MKRDKWNLWVAHQRADVAEARVKALEAERAELLGGGRVIVQASMLKDLTDEVNAREQHWQKVAAALRERAEHAELERDDLAAAQVPPYLGTSLGDTGQVRREAPA